MSKRKLLTLLSLMLILALVMVACGGDEEAEEPAPEGEAAEPTGTFLERARAGEFDGTEVNIFGAFVDEDARRFEASMVPFEEESGIAINYEGSGDFETLINVRLEAGDEPDIAAHPQPGLLGGFVANGFVPVQVTEFIPMETLQSLYTQGWIDDSTFEGPDGGDFVAGVWYRASPKSFVWYPKDDFEAAGYEIPTTWDEMLALSDQIVADGGVPWCIGIESSGATGWVATDWMEDLMLRMNTPEQYDQWVTGELDFNSPEVTAVAEKMAEIWFNEDYVLGGRTGIVNTPFGDAPTSMFDDPPSCWLHRQANFITSFFPDGAEVGTNVDYFYLPPIEAGEQPVLVAGDIMTMYVDRPEVRAVMEWLAQPESKRAWVESGGMVSANFETPTEWYPTDADAGYAEILNNATVTRFDASDLMPGAVGAGTFWTEITEWVGGNIELETALQNIDESFPSE